MIRPSHNPFIGEQALQHQLQRKSRRWRKDLSEVNPVPGAIMRAYAMALQPPAGPVYLSIPLDDWDQPALGPAVVRTVSARFAPDGDRVRDFANRISAAKKVALVYGAEIERSVSCSAREKSQP
jgi:benzoylformate decarboxylase